MSDATLSTLEQIRIKIRRLTRSPSVNQLSNQNIDDYINTFVLYDFPEHVRLKALRGNFTFYTEPYVDTYANNTTDLYSPLYNFINKYITFHPPVYLNVTRIAFEQSQANFYASYPKTTMTVSVGEGDGVEDTYFGTLDNIPFLKNNVQFSSVYTDNSSAIVIDDGAGTLTEATAGGVVTVGSIDYQTGAYSLTFENSIKDKEQIYAETCPYVASKPQVILYYDNKFTVRPIPDRPYKIEIECYLRPTELLSDSQAPELSEWWQYIAYGAAKKVFEDRMDLESVSLIMPEFKEQELLVLRRTLVQQSDQRANTIYETDTENIRGSGSDFGGFFF